MKDHDDLLVTCKNENLNNKKWIYLRNCMHTHAIGQQYVDNWVYSNLLSYHLITEKYRLVECD